MDRPRRAVVMAFLAALLAAWQQPKNDQAAAFFKEGRIPRLTITLSDEHLKQLRSKDREYTSCSIKEGDAELTDVGIHLKGAAGSFRPFDDKPALTLKLDRFVAGQRFHGLDKIHLNNSVQDPSYLTEIVCGELFLAAKVPTARATHAIVDLQGKKRGLYVLKEGYDAAFLKRHFGDATGHLYDGGFLTDIDGPIRKSGGQPAPEHADLKALVAACREPDPAQRFARIDKLLDIDRFLTMMAIEVMTWHWDGYGMKANNYRIYHDPKSDKLVFIPHGMDQMFWDPNGAISPPMQGLVARALFELPDLRKRYYRRMGELSATIFTADKLGRRIEELRGRVKPAAAEIDADFAKEVDQQIDQLKSRAQARARHVERAIKDKLEQIAQRP